MLRMFKLLIAIYLFIASPAGASENLIEIQDVAEVISVNVTSDRVIFAEIRFTNRQDTNICLYPHQDPQHLIVKPAGDARKKAMFSEGIVPDDPDFPRYEFGHNPYGFLDAPRKVRLKPGEAWVGTYAADLDYFNSISWLEDEKFPWKHEIATSGKYEIGLWGYVATCPKTELPAAEFYNEITWQLRNGSRGDFRVHSLATKPSEPVQLDFPPSHYVPYVTP